MVISTIVGTGDPGDTLIAIVAGSESDLKIMAESGMFDILTHAGISFELHVISADRNPDEIDEFCRKVNSKGKVRVIVTIAGLAAVLASTIKARVGITKVLAASLDDASQSANINKPKGTAVAVFGANGQNACYNATMFACEIIADSDPVIAENLEAYAGMKRVEKPAEFCIDPEAVKKNFSKGIELKGTGKR